MDLSGMDLAWLFLGGGLVIAALTVYFMHKGGAWDQKEVPGSMSVPGPGGYRGETWVKAPAEGAVVGTPVPPAPAPVPSTPAQQDRPFGCCRLVRTLMHAYEAKV